MNLHRLSIILLLLVSSGVNAQGFSALVSPPRIEGTVKAGTTYREVIEITNVSDANAHFNFYTADWTLDANASAVFDSKLAPSSCRPWVGIEAKGITLGPRGKRRYRFEVAVPANATPGECRFAIMVEGDPETVTGKVAVPVSGRIAVIVYLAIGDVAANLKILTTGTKMVGGKKYPAVKVTNTGNAHTRLEGYADLIDAKGGKWTVVPESFPILPGETRLIALVPQVEENKPAADLAYPVKVSGKLDSGKDRVPVAFTVSQ